MPNALPDLIYQSRMHDFWLYILGSLKSFYCLLVALVSSQTTDKDTWMSSRLYKDGRYCAFPADVAVETYHDRSEPAGWTTEAHIRSSVRAWQKMQPYPAAVWVSPSKTSNNIKAQDHAGDCMFAFNERCHSHLSIAIHLRYRSHLVPQCASELDPLCPWTCSRPRGDPSALRLCVLHIHSARFIAQAHAAFPCLLYQDQCSDWAFKAGTCQRCVDTWNKEERN